MSFQETLNYLYELYNKTYCKEEDNDFNILKNCLENNKNLTNNNIPSATAELETFSLSNPKYIKVCRNPIPNGVLPPENVGFLYDINVYISREFRIEKRKKFLTDDDVYESFPLIQKNIPRGVTICKIVNKYDDSNVNFYETTIYANKKFTDIPNNINDNNYLYFLQNPSKPKKIISMEKMNGDALHFSGRYLLGNFYLFVGSKNNHVMIKSESDIELYTDDRYVVSKQFARIVWKMLQNLSPPNRNALYDIFHYTEVTAVCELLQPNYQHIVKISNTESKVVFLTFTPTFYGLDDDDINKSLTFLPPHLSLRIMNILDIPCAPHRIMIIDDDKKYREEIENIRSNINSEGRVFYFLNNNKDETIGLSKVKTVWYICLRALREKCVHHFSKKSKYVHIPTVVNSVNTRYTEIQNWLKLSDDIINYWNNIGEQFVIWLKKQINENLIDIRQNPIKSNFPILWDKFNQDFNFV